MGTLDEILKMLKEGKKLAPDEGETKRYRISIKDGKVEATVEVIPDLDALSLQQLYELQEEYETRIEALNDEEPDEEEDPEAYEKWEEAVELLEQDLEEVNDKIEELEESAEDVDEDG